MHPVLQASGNDLTQFTGFPVWRAAGPARTMEGMSKRPDAGPTWWKLADALDHRAGHLIDRLAGCAGDAKLPVLEELLQTLDAQRELLRCAIDAVTRQTSAPGVGRSGAGRAP